jgi:hypothetical protein
MNVENKKKLNTVVSVEWHKHNTLTAATLPEFKKAMKKADKDWDVANGG